MTISKTPLPPPKIPFASWSALLKELWRHGRSRGIQPAWLTEKYAFRAKEACVEAFQREGTEPVVRPSFGLACAQQTYYCLMEEHLEPMPDEIPMTFAIGHFLHELSYASIDAALPEGFEIEVEKEVDLTVLPWWPKDNPLFNMEGHVDLIIRVADRDLASKYLAEEECDDTIVDFKTMGGYSYREHRKKTYLGNEPDGFGYLAQLAVYTSALIMQEQGAILAGINRDILMAPLLPRLVSPTGLERETQRVKAAIEGAIRGIPAGPEFKERFYDQADFFCGTYDEEGKLTGNRKKGYCPYKLQCAKDRGVNYEV